MRVGVSSLDAGSEIVREVGSEMESLDCFNEKNVFIDACLSTKPPWLTPTTGLVKTKTDTASPLINSNKAIGENKNRHGQPPLIDSINMIGENQNRHSCMVCLVFAYVFPKQAHAADPTRYHLPAAMHAA